MKLHLCCGDVYLTDYINCDIIGYVVSDDRKTIIHEYPSNERIDNVGWRNITIREIKDYTDINETTLDNYFKFPFIQDPIERAKNKRPFIIDKKMNILEKWDFKDSSIDEIVMISCIEHFNPVTELPHILSEINRVMKIGGKLVIDWPDLVKQMMEYYGVDDNFMIELIYCNHKHEYAIHHWGFTHRTFPNYLGKNWDYDFKQVVKHSYPMQGCVATKVS